MKRILFDEETADRVTWRPVFYRVRSAGVRFGGGIGGDRRLEVTVFGKGREKRRDVDGQHMEFTLWAHLPGRGGIVDCPPRWIDIAAIEGLVLGPVGE